MLFPPLCAVLCAMLCAPSAEVPSFATWFPDGIYLDLSYSRIDPAAEGLKIYRDCADPTLSRLYQGIPFGAELRQMIRELAGGSTIRGRVSYYTAEQMKKAAKEMQQAGNIGGVQTADGTYAVRSGRKYFWLSVTDRRAFLEKALALGEMKDSGESVAGQPVYLIRGMKNDVERGSDFFGFFTETDDLLVSSSIDELRKMAATGNGEIPALADNSFYTDLLVDAGSYGTAWSVYNSGAVNQAVLEEMEARGESREARVSLERELAGAALDLFGFVIDAGLTRYHVMFCPDRKAMEANTAEFRDNLGEGCVFESSGTKLIERLTYDAKTIERERNRMQQMMKAWEERQKAAAEAKEKTKS